MAVGTAFVQVVPSLRGFHRQARQDLARENITGTITLRPQIDTRAARSEAETTARNIGRVQVTLTPNLDASGVRAQASTVAESLRRSVPFVVGLDSGGAQGQASAHASALRRSVPFAVNLDATGAGAQASAQAGFLRRSVPFAVNLDTAGARTQADIAALSMRRTVTFHVDVDRNVLGSAVGAVMAGGSSMASAGAGVGGSFAHAGLMIATLGPLIVAAVGVAAAAIMALPAAIGALAIPIAAILIGIEGIKAAAATVAPAFAPIQAAVAGTFQAVLTPVFQTLTALVPILQAGLVGTAQALGVVASALAGVVTSAAGMAWLQQIFAGVNMLISGMAPVLATLTAGFMQLAAVGIGPLAAGLITAVGQFAVMFQQMIAQTAATGLLQASITLFTQVLGVLLMILPPLLQAGMQMFMIFGPAMMQAFTALIPVLGPVMQLFGILAQIFFLILAALMPVIGAIAQALMPVLVALSPIIGFIAWVLGTILVGALSFITPALQVLAPVIAFLLVLWGLWTLYTWAQVAAQWALNIAMWANPFGLIAGLLLLLVVAVIWAWTNFAWFREIVMAAWHGIAFAAIWAWHNILQPIFAFWGMILTWIGGAFLWFWQAVVVPAWHAIAAVAVWAWYNIMLPIFSFMGAVIVGVAGFFIWLWQSVMVPAWQGIVAVAAWAWHNVLAPIFSFIGTAIAVLAAILFTVLVAPWIIAWNILSSIAVWAWNTILRPVFDAIGAVISWVWSAVIQPVFGFIGSAWNALCGFIADVWNGVLRPAWQAVADFAGWLWNSTLSVVFGLISAGWNGLCGFIRLIWDTVLRPTWDALQAAARWMWENVLRPVFDFIGQAWNGLLMSMRMFWDTILRPCWEALQTAARWMWENVLRPVFDAIGAAWRALLDGIRIMWENVLRPAFDAIKGAVHSVGEAFAAAVRWIGDVWNTIKGLLARPINFMINVVYMRGIKAAWDTVAGWLKLPPLPGVAPIPEFSRGGKVPGAGNRDTVPAWLTPGEYVISKPVVDYWGLNNIDRAHSATKGHRNSKRKGRQEGLMAQGYAAGGEVALDRAFKFAQSMNGKAYVFGGGSEAGTDCSGYMAMIKRALLDERPYGRREWATETGMPPPGFVHGMSAGFSIGVKHGGAGGGHTAGTLGGVLGFPPVNVEAGGSHNTSAFGGPAAGADHPQFGNEHYRIPFIDGAFVSGGGGGGGGSVPNPVAVMLHGLKHGITDPIRGGIGAGIDALLGGGDEPGTWKSGAKGSTFKIFDSIVEWVDKKVDELFPPLAGFGGGGGGIASANPNVVEAVRETARQFGWDQGPQWDALAWIIGKESGWNPTAANPTSAARGLFQKMTSVHGPVEPTPGGQALWGMNYIRGRYRDPLGAKAFWERNGHYDSGGWLPPGLSLAYNGTGRPEAVLTADQWDSLRSANENPGTSITVNYAESDVDPQRVAAAIDRRLAMTGRV